MYINVESLEISGNLPRMDNFNFLKENCYKNQQSLEPFRILRGHYRHLSVHMLGRQSTTSVHVGGTM